VKTTSGATAVQIVHSSRRGSRDIEHIGSAHDDVELELLKAAARQRLAAGQGELDLGLERAEPVRRGTGGGPPPITSSRMSCLLDSLERAYRVLGFEDATGGDEVFAQLVLAVSKLDSLRVLEEARAAPASYRTVTRRPAHHHRRRPLPQRPPPGPRSDQRHPLTCALAWPKSGISRGHRVLRVYDHIR